MEQDEEMRIIGKAYSESGHFGDHRLLPVNLDNARRDVLWEWITLTYAIAVWTRTLNEDPAVAAEAAARDLYLRNDLYQQTMAQRDASLVFILEFADECAAPVHQDPAYSSGAAHHLRNVRISF